MNRSATDEKHDGRQRLRSTTPALF